MTEFGAVKGVILAGGEGSRLLPFTKFTHKTLLPLFDKPVIDYALGTMRGAGIRDITIVANRHVGQIAQHVGTGVAGERIHYVIEETPMGVANALSLVRPYVEGSRMLLYFSDNITTWDFSKDVASFRKSDSNPGSILLAREVDDPAAFGICEFDEGGEIVGIEEKPEHPKSNLAIGGIYLFDELFWKIFDGAIDRVGKSFSISEITREYVAQGMATVRNIGRKTWIDCGTPESLLDASNLARDGSI
ncbi:MAG: sugar phosphate nucleotidyltransferase [Candidatus Thalassarchaeaceae archaeon]